MSVSYQQFFNQTLNQDGIEFRFIPINEETQKAYPTFDIDKVYDGEHPMNFEVANFNLITNELDKHLKSFKANIELVNDYEIICKTDKEYIQIYLKNLVSDTYYALVGPIRQWIEWRKNNVTEQK